MDATFVVTRLCPVCEQDVSIYDPQICGLFNGAPLIICETCADNAPKGFIEVYREPGERSVAQINRLVYGGS